MRRSALRVLTAAALTISALAAAPATAAQVEPGAAHQRAADPLQIRVGTYNINVRASTETLKRAVSQVKPYVDVLGLQEITTMAKTRWLLSADRNWGYYNPPQARQNPVIWDRNQLDFLSGRAVKLSNPRKVERRKRGGAEIAGRNWATVVHLFHRATGQRISFINVHLVHGAVSNGAPAKGRPKAFRLYRSQLAKVVRAAKSERSVSDQVYVLGDFNSGYEADAKHKRKKLPVKRFRKIGFKPMWKGSSLLPKRYGTHGAALLDYVWNPDRPVSTQILKSVRGSDHRPAVATYRLPAPDPTYVAPTGSIGFAGAPPVRNEYTRVTGKYVEVELTGDLSHGYATVRLNPEASTAEVGKDLYIDDSSYLAGSRTIYLKINKDKTREPDETYTLELVDPVNMTVIPGSGSVTGVIAANKS